MARVIVEVPAQKFVFDLEDFGGEEEFLDENGYYDSDAIYEEIIHHAVQDFEYDWNVIPSNGS